MKMHKNFKDEWITSNIGLKNAYIDPVHVLLEFVDGMSQQLGVTLFKVWLMHCEATQFSSAYGGKIRRMRE